MQASIVMMAFVSVEAYQTHRFLATEHYLRVLGNRHFHNGYLYASGYDEGAVYRFDGKNWTHLGHVSPKSTQTYGFTVCQGSLHVSEWPQAEVYRYDGVNQWTSIGKLGNEKESMPLTVYNGKMFSGTLPLAAVYRYDGGTS